VLVRVVVVDPGQDSRRRIAAVTIGERRDIQVVASPVPPYDQEPLDPQFGAGIGKRVSLWRTGVRKIPHHRSMISDVIICCYGLLPAERLDIVRVKPGPAWFPELDPLAGPVGTSEM
jgi:hypothetical protein